jgi:surface-anchored protein
MSLIRSVRPLALLSLGAFLALIQPESKAAPGLDLYHAGHGDIAAAYEDGAFTFHLHLGENAYVNGLPVDDGHDAHSDPHDHDHHEFDPATTAIHVAPWTHTVGGDTFTSPFPSPDSGFANLTGVAVGNPLYWLPSFDVPDRPFLGIATEELDPADWVGPITWTLESLVGPGSFTLLNEGVPLWATFTGLNTPLEVPAGGHDHFDMLFGALGDYQITFRVTGTHRVDGLKTGTGTYNFVIANQAIHPVPEPSTLAGLGLGLGLLALARHRTGRRLLA